MDATTQSELTTDRESEEDNISSTLLVSTDRKFPGRPPKNDDSDLLLNCRWGGSGCDSEGVMFASPREAREHELKCHIRRNESGEHVCLIRGCCMDTDELKSFLTVDKFESHFNKVHAWRHLECKYCEGVRYADQNKLYRHSQTSKCKAQRRAVQQQGDTVVEDSLVTVSSKTDTKEKTKKRVKDDGCERKRQCVQAADSSSPPVTDDNDDDDDDDGDDVATTAKDHSDSPKCYQHLNTQQLLEDLFPEVIDAISFIDSIPQNLDDFVFEDVGEFDGVMPPFSCWGLDVIGVDPAFGLGDLIC